MVGLPVLFYCHYPDKLLCTERAGLFKRIYRKPIDWLEEVTTGLATRVVVNSKFTGRVFEESFPNLNISTAVLYPAIELAQFDVGLSSEERGKGRPQFYSSLIMCGCRCSDTFVRSKAGSGFR